MLRIAINGYGRIGRAVLRALYENHYRDSIQVVAINELSDLETISYLTRYDTTHGRFAENVSLSDGKLVIADDEIQMFAEENPHNIDWSALEIDLLLECSGSFATQAEAQHYIDAGVPRILLSQPADSGMDNTIVYGFNHANINSSHTIVSAASCTTNCLIPVLDCLEDLVGVESGATQTIHSAMNDQPVIDAYHQQNLRLTRAALSSIIPVDTGLAKGISRLLPQLDGKIACNAVRVPTLNVSVIDMVVRTRQAVTATQINQHLQHMAETKYHHLIGYSEEVHASVDFNHDARSVIIDATQTKVVDGHLVKLLCWFDNEWAYANRMLDVTRHWAGII
ncbi:erythrose-4-phosphate dehydrogenase [Marinomonas agarivorans]|nr:erythrose-4-phosphate dehydrogenase [Marinomonas agarivorans]